MRPRFQLLRASHSITIGPRHSDVSFYPLPLCIRLQQQRSITADEKPSPEAENPPGPNQEQLPHVSEEAATTGEITGEGGPEIEQGTPVQEVLNRDEKSREKAPQVIKDAANSSATKGTRSYSTSARRLLQTQDIVNPDPAELLPPGPIQSMVNSGSGELQPPGHLFGLPQLPLPSTSHIKHRYDPIIHQVTNLLMKDGKLSVAQRNMAMILERLRTAPPPTPDRRHPLIPGAPPPTHLPLNPILYLTLSIDSVAPLLRIRSQKGAAGGGVALQIPIPLGLRQRRRTAVMWILDAVSKKRSKGSGRTMFAHKVADELISIVEGKSSVWERRGGVHRLGVAARANLTLGNRRRK